ncbi:MAG: hypothetical protein Q8N62_01985 [Candidatus Omnitrophota bacterium]|nr:hypothetical protein [Candidatus Omnitrophota bacterium]
MPESAEERQKRELKELEGKNIANYQVLLSAWIQTRMERDKAVVTVSAVAIGLLVTLLTTVGVYGFWQRLLTIGAFLGFLGAIWISLTIYELNANHIEYSLRGGNDKDPKLEKCDKLSKIFFSLGIICMMLLGLIATFTNKGGDMAKEGKKSNAEQKLKESINGVQKLSPTQLEIGKSLSGIGNLSPQNLAPSDSTVVQSISNDEGNKNSQEKK